LPGVADSTGEGDGEKEYRQHRFTRPPGATEIILVRHGESAPARLDQPPPSVDGRSDPPLDPQGQKEADRVADRLQDVGVDAIYVTSLRRTVETAAPLAARLGLEPQVEPDLTEVYLGEWEGGIFRKHFAENHPIALQARTESRWDAIPGAESNEAFQARIRAGIARIVTAHPDQRVVAVTHGGVIGTIVEMATGARAFAFAGSDNGSISHLVVLGEHWLIRRFNDTSHLDTDLDRPVQPLI